MGKKILLVHWGGQNLNISVIFKSAMKNKTKIKENREFLHKIGFRENRFWFLVQL